MRQILLLATIMLTVVMAKAQPAPSEEKLEALRIAFLTKQLNLSPEEAQQFWPVYNSYTAEAKKLNMELKAGKLTQLKFEEKMLDLRKGYQPKFTKAVGDAKFEKFLQADRDWRDLVRREIEKRRQGQGMQNRRGIQLPY